MENTCRLPLLAWHERAIVPHGRVPLIPPPRSGPFLIIVQRLNFARFPSLLHSLPTLRTGSAQQIFDFELQPNLFPVHSLTSES
jgi:hypothetical protein